MPWDPQTLQKNITHVATTNTVAVGATGGPGLLNDGTNFTVQMPYNAEGYELVINPTLSANNVFACDINVDHIDSATGQIVCSELFTTGNWAGKAGSTATLRGKLFGDQMALTVTNAANAFIQGTPINRATATGSPIFINILGLPDYYPAVARVLPNSLTAQPIGTLVSQSSDAVPAAGNTILNAGNCLVPYHGLASFFFTTRSGGGFQGHIQINMFSVSNGAVPLQQIDTAQIQAAGVGTGPTAFNIILPALIVQLNWIPGAAVAGNVESYAVGGYD